MDNQYNRKALKKYNSNKIKLNSSNLIKKEEAKQEENNKEQIKTNQEDNIKNDVKSIQSELITNEFLLNGKCRVCNLEDRTCRCLRFSKNYTPRICYCGDKECDFDCGVLDCGCIDVCRKHRDYYDDY